MKGNSLCSSIVTYQQNLTHIISVSSSRYFLHSSQRITLLCHQQFLLTLSFLICFMLRSLYIGRQWARVLGSFILHLDSRIQINNYRTIRTWKNNFKFTIAKHLITEERNKISSCRKTHCLSLQLSTFELEILGL